MKIKFGFYALIIIFLLPACRTITQSAAKIDLSPSLVYLSFDDGPNAYSDTTACLLDILKKYQVQALFCLLGENAEHSPELVRRIHDEGHYIINHGYADKWASKMTDDEFSDNLIRGEEAISAALGAKIDPLLYRPHGGFYHSRQEALYGAIGYTLVPASIRVHDAVLDGTKRRRVLRQIIRKVESQNGGLILLHDMRGSYCNAEKELEKKPDGAFNRSWIPDLVDELIPLLQDRGFIISSPAQLYKK